MAAELVLSAWNVDLAQRKSIVVHRGGACRVRWMGVVYEDFEGVVYRGRTDVVPGIASGTVSHAAGTASSCQPKLLERMRTHLRTHKVIVGKPIPAALDAWGGSLPWFFMMEGVA